MLLILVLKTVKAECSNHSFKIVDQYQFFKEVNKTSQNNDTPIKIMKENINIIPYILYTIVSMTHYLTLCFQVN